MKRNRFHGLRSASLAVLALAALLGLVACTAGSSSTASGVPAQRVELTGYLLGSAPAGMPEVMAELNKRLSTDLNAGMTINYIGWGDLNSKYPLILAAGEGVDWIYTADWCQYTPQAVRGAFAELTMDQIQKYMPRHFAATPKEAWEQAKVKGKIYMIPTATPDRKVPVIMIRGDLRKKYNLPPVTKMSELGPYLQGIAKNEPGMIPMNLDNGYDLGQPWGGLMNELVPANTPVQISSNASGSPFLANYEDPARSVWSVFDEPYASAFKKASSIMKEWYDAGLINKNPFANTVLSRESFQQGKSGVAFANSQAIQESLNKARELGFDPEIIPILSSSGTYPADPHTNNGVAIAASSKNIERTLQFLDLIMEDPAYNFLVYYGLEGVNYVLTEDGRIDLPGGLRAEQNTYAPDAAGFWFTNKDQFKPMKSWSQEYIDLRAKVKDMLFASTVTGFTFVPDTVKTEVSNLVNVWGQYAGPLYIGAVDKVDSAFATLQDKLKTASMDKVIAELKVQMAAFSADRK